MRLMRAKTPKMRFKLKNAATKALILRFTKIVTSASVNIHIFDNLELTTGGLLPGFNILRKKVSQKLLYKEAVDLKVTFALWLSTPLEAIKHKTERQNAPFSFSNCGDPVWRASSQKCCRQTLAVKNFANPECAPPPR